MPKKNVKLDMGGGFTNCFVTYSFYRKFCFISIVSLEAHLGKVSEPICFWQIIASFMLVIILHPLLNVYFLNLSSCE